MDTPAIGPLGTVGDAAAGPSQRGIDTTSDSELYRALREALRWREREGRQRRRQAPVPTGERRHTSETGEPDLEGHVELYL